MSVVRSAVLAGWALSASLAIGPSLAIADDLPAATVARAEALRDRALKGSGA